MKIKVFFILCFDQSGRNVNIMFKGVKYRKLEGNEYYIKEYFDALFFFRKSDVVNALESFCKFVGYTINDYMSCHFAVEFPPTDEEYFGEEGVVF